jgi:hypothetical protein
LVILSEAKDLQSADLLRDLASAPRPTGTSAIAAARERCTRELRALGYAVTEQPFEFSSFVGRAAFPLFGGLTAFIGGTAGLLAMSGWRYAPLTVLVGGIIGLFVFGRWLLARGILTLPLLRASGVNLEATIAGDDPSIWLCAHVDTKSQPIPTLLRTAAIILESIGILLIGMLAVISALGGTPLALLWDVAALVTLLGAIPVVLCVVGTNSPGALDNASGVVAVVAAAREMRGQRGVGVLITDAEELALAGARAWSLRRGRNTTVLNCDGVDDAGEVYVMFGGARPERVLQVVANESRATGIEHQPRRLGLGILTDSIAFTDAGLTSVTFSRGSFASLARVHSPRDSLANLRGSGITDTAALMAATARALVTIGAR